MANLLRRKHPQNDLFICDIIDAAPKDDMASMENPIFSLSKNPDKKIIKYEHNGKFIEITPSVLGRATIFDKDILIFAISQLMAKINLGEEPSQTIQFSAYDLFISINKATDGRSYIWLKKAFLRLKGTTITTDILINNKPILDGFGLIDSFRIIRESPKGRMEGLEIKLSDWLYETIKTKQVLSLSPDYFRLGKPLERRIYEICRKHCGYQKIWAIGLEKLHKKSGSTSPLRNFRIAIKDIIQSDHLPDYKIYFDPDKKDKLIIRPRIAVVNEPETVNRKPYIKTETYTNAKKILGRDFDVYAIEEEWLMFWTKSGSPELKTNDGAFINFCKHKIKEI